MILHPSNEILRSLRPLRGRRSLRMTSVFGFKCPTYPLSKACELKL